MSDHSFPGLNRWRVTYWDQQTVQVRKVFAESRSQALKQSGIPRDRVVKVSRSLRFFRQDLVKHSASATNAQLLFLVQLSALLSSYRNQGINALVQASPEFKRVAARHPDALRDDLNFSVKLAHLGFPRPVTAIVSAGEKTGRVKECVDEAVKYLKTELDVARNASKHLAFSFLLFGLSVLVFFALPFFVGEPLAALQSLDEVHLSTTWATDVLFGVNRLLRHHLLFLIAAIFSTAGLAWFFRLQILRVYPFNVFERFAKCSRSIRLLLVWRPYRLTGVPLEQESAVLKAVLGENIGAHLLAAMKRGVSLYKGLDEKHFSLSLVAASSELANAGSEDFDRISGVLLDSLSEEKRLMSEKLAALLYLASLTLAVGTIMLVAFGLIYPILGATTAVGL